MQYTLLRFDKYITFFTDFLDISESVEYNYPQHASFCTGIWR